MNRVTLRQAVALLRAGQVVAFPTDTAYGLAADARSDRAVARVKIIKGRDARKPIALIAADLTQVKRFFRLTAVESRLAKKYWPGPLTLVLTPRTRAATPGLRKASVRRSGVGREQPASTPIARWALGARRIGVRVPKLGAARTLARELGAPITATSANRSGRGPWYTADAVVRELPTVKILFHGRLPRRAPSTVVEVRRGKIIIHRPGPIRPAQ